MAVYLAVDLGTTGCRSILYADDLKELGSAYEEYGLITPQNGYVEQDANGWWQMTLRTAKKVLSDAQIDPAAVSAISISSQGISVVPIDENGMPLCNALSWLDVRAETQAGQLRQDWGEELQTITGKPISAAYTLPKLLWLQQERPDIWDKAWKFLMPMDFLIYKLTGKTVTDHSMASGTLLYDLQNTAWCGEILERYNISEERLPSLAWSGTIAGTVLPEVAEQLGISDSCVVAVGAQDQKCAALGVGLDEETITISLGTAGAVTKLWRKTDTEHLRNVGWCGYTQAGTWVTEGVISTAGTCLRWVRDMLFKNEQYSVINTEAQKALENGSNLQFYPYMNGPSSPDYYKNAEGCFYGVNLATTRGNFALAVMEGVAFQIRIVLEAMQVDSTVKRIVLFGGGAKSALWCQIIADATGLELLVPTSAEAAGAGAAMLAAQATGMQLRPLSCGCSYKPCRQVAYEQKYQAYRALEKKIWGQEDRL